jgi:hypothetical protein
MRFLAFDCADGASNSKQLGGDLRVDNLRGGVVDDSASGDDSTSESEDALQRPKQAHRRPKQAPVRRGRTLKDAFLAIVVALLFTIAALIPEVMPKLLKIYLP